MSKRIWGMGLAVLLALPGVASATLVLSGDGLTVHDSVTNLDWLQNANANGLMNWADANTWAAGLTVGGFTNWRLPTTLQPDSSCDVQSNQGSSFPLQGFGLNCTGSEMGHLFYNELGGVANTSILSTHNASFGLFSYVQSNIYWSGTEFAPNPTNAWGFNFRFGNQVVGRKDSNFFAWAVRSGDVAASSVPEPGTIALLGLGLVGIGFNKRRKRRL